MRRAPLVLAGTVAGLVLVLGYRTPELGTTVSTPTSSQVEPGTDGSTQGRTAAGDVVQTRWGAVQVQVTVADGALTDVSALQLPANDPRSAQISQYAQARLREQALAAQSAQIDGISGATFTSAAYAESLQSALDALGVGT
ncbi:MAG: FMN-binding protein [Actinomycetia bacterium]|jgi:uncharacterized protein with FMN-binding domain|nr:FMN-binding protein [Actinomycetes bacterium]